MSEAKQYRIYKNSDNDHSEPIVGEGLIVGYVDEVNGEGAMEVPEFSPTRNELLQLVRYWSKIRLDIDWWFFSTGCSGSTEYRLDIVAARRIARITNLLGKVAADSAMNDVLSQFKNEHEGVIAHYKQHHKIDIWRAFTGGDKRLWNKVHEQLIRLYDA